MTLTIPKISSYYSPATVLFVDDNSAFLSSLALKVNKKLIYRMCHDPLQALAIIKKNSQSDMPIDACLKGLVNSEENFNNPEDHAFSINLSNLYQEIYNTQRFKNINLVVVDHDMPEINGVEFCRHLKELPVKKIMLTGVASHSKAVEAFNEGIIDRFIDKASPELFTTLNKAIEELQKIYYLEQSKVLIQTIVNQFDSCLANVEFHRLFKQLCAEKNISEFYQLDPTGSFILLDYVGKIIFLLIKTEQEMNDYFAIAAENSAPENITEALKNKRKLPFFLTNSDYQLSFDKWEHYLHPAQPLGENKKYYYSIVEGKSNYQLMFEKIISHKQYLNLLITNQDFYR